MGFCGWCELLTQVSHELPLAKAGLAVPRASCTWHSACASYTHIRRRINSFDCCFFIARAGKARAKRTPMALKNLGGATPAKGVVQPTSPRSAESHIAFWRPRRDHFQRNIKRLQKCRCYCCPSLWRRKDARSAHAKRLQGPWPTDTRERGGPAHLSTKRRVPHRLSAPAP